MRPPLFLFIVFSTAFILFVAIGFGPTFSLILAAAVAIGAFAFLGRALESMRVRSRWS